MYRSDHAHEAALINTKGDIFCGGGTKSASRMCPPGHNPLAEFIRGDNNWGRGGGGGGWTKSAMTPAMFLVIQPLSTSTVGHVFA